MPKPDVDLGQKITVEMGTETFITRFAKFPGTNIIDTENVGVIWKNGNEEPWIIFRRDNRGNIKSTNRRGNQRKCSWINVPEKIFELMRRAARKHFYWHDRLNIKVWNKIIYPDLLPPENRKTIFKPAKNPGGLTAKRPDPNFLPEDDKEIQDARNYRRYMGKRYKDHNIHGLTTRRRYIRPQRGTDYDQLEDLGQGTLPLDDPLDF